MLYFIDINNKQCFIMAPKCGTTTVADYLNIQLHTHQPDPAPYLSDNSFKKYIIVRKNIYSRFLSGFYEDLFNNNCYNNIHITFDEYLSFLLHCFNNKIVDVNNLNVYLKNDTFVDWGNCSGMSLPLTNDSGEFVSHIISQKYAIGQIVELIDGSNVQVIDLPKLNTILLKNIHKIRNLLRTRAN